MKEPERRRKMARRGVHIRAGGTLFVARGGALEARTSLVSVGGRTADTLHSSNETTADSRMEQRSKCI